MTRPLPPKDDTASKELATFITERRGRIGLSQERLAELVGVSPGFIAHVEKARRPISDALELPFCEALEMDQQMWRRFHRLRIQAKVATIRRTFDAAEAELNEAVREEQL